MHTIKTYFAVAVLAGAACTLALPAQARTISFKTPNQLKSTCVAARGDYNAPGYAGVYSCQLKGGAIIACGGNGEFAKTCESSAPKTILNPVLVRGSSLDSAGVISTREPAAVLSPALSDSVTY